MPGRIGTVEVRNRIVMAPMISNLAQETGATDEAHISFLAARARGGAGLVITEYTYVDGQNSRGSRNELGAHREDLVPKLRRLTEAIHENGSLVFLQLVHAGGKAALSTNPEPPMAPSPLDYGGHSPREMTPGDMDRVVESFRRAARVGALSNFDGLEVHAAHAYLLHEFLSPALNRREDRYGGPFENRLRLVQEVLDAVRGEAGLPLGIRLSLYEDEPDGYPPEYGVQVAERLRGLDYVHFSAGRFAPPGSSASFGYPTLHILRRLPRRPSLPTMVVGSVVDAMGVEQVLEKVDFVSVGRAMLADPNFAWKVMHDPEGLRPCIRCNQACRDLRWGEVRCTVNPDTGHESDRPCPRPIEGPVAIVGGGVKGLEAALQASLAGATVTLYEAREALGGQLLDIPEGAKREEFLRLVRYYETVLHRRGVSLRLGTRYDGDGVDCRPDRVYEDIRRVRPSVMDSPVYEHLDEALELARTQHVTVTERSLSALDPVRASRFREEAIRRGVTFEKGPTGPGAFSEEGRRQYDIREAMLAGRRALEEYLRRRDGLPA
jgi:2,4-dienoyl-CoA reductase-like NADH-dependent reductase (Old Yellow Enzyme family)